MPKMKILITKLIYFVLDQTGYENIAKILIENNVNVHGLLCLSSMFGSVLLCPKSINYLLRIFSNS